MAEWMLLSFLVSLAGTWLARRYALQRQLIDQPGERRSHAAPTPRGGGIGIAVAVLVAAAVLAWRVPAQAPSLAGLFACVLLVAAVGWVDDHRPLRARTRFAVQLLAGLALAAGFALQSGPGPLPVLAFAAVLVLANVWNFMDGIDGLAASQAALVAVALALATDGAARWIALALFAAALGFLPFNFPRARIFLGDVGSGALGAALAYLAVAAARADAATWLLVALPFSAFLLDAGLTLARRVLRRERWWLPHVQHAYQRVAARRGGHVAVTVAFALWTLAGAVAMLLVRGTSPAFILALVLAWYTVGGFAWAFAQRWATPRPPAA